MSRYIGPVKWLGGIAILLFVFSAVFSSTAPSLLSETVRSGVLFHAIPFFAAFVGILLIFVLLIVLVATRFNGKVPGRTYQGIENLAIAGIIFGTICLFNPWSIVPYRYGFILLLLSTLGFILWSHVLPPRADFDTRILPLSQMQQIVGVIAGVIVLALFTYSAIAANAPREPYGLRQRVWDSYEPERQAEVAAAATQEFSSVEVPFLVIFNLFPAGLAYFVARELVGGRKTMPEPGYAMPGAAAGGD